MISFLRDLAITGATFIPCALVSGYLYWRLRRIGFGLILVWLMLLFVLSIGHRLITHRKGNAPEMQGIAMGTGIPLLAMVFRQTDKNQQKEK